MAFVKQGHREDAPPWVDMSAWGVFSVAPENAPGDLHFHDCDEYWLITDGSALVLCGDEEQVMGPGDLLCARMGELHHVVEIYGDEPFRGAYVVGPLRGQKRTGHLHPGTHDLPAPEDIDASAR
jgi:mannose-6-phosphate isomerase-like protein (cupin superfamily)